jgi:hypothetical protein
VTVEPLQRVGWSPADILEKVGAAVLSPAQDRPQWGPNLRTAHLRAPDGTLLELQSY